VVVGLCARETRGREGGWAKTRNRAVVARFMARRGQNDDGGWCVGVVWWCVQGDGGGGVVRSRNASRRVGLGQKHQNRAAVAQFRVRRWK
jgi:hypothetical protein